MSGKGSPRLSLWTLLTFRGQVMRRRKRGRSGKGSQRKTRVCDVLEGRSKECLRKRKSSALSSKMRTKSDH